MTMSYSHKHWTRETGLGLCHGTSMGREPVWEVRSLTCVIPM